MAKAILITSSTELDALTSIFSGLRLGKYIVRGILPDVGAAITVEDGAAVDCDFGSRSSANPEGFVDASRDNTGTSTDL